MQFAREVIGIELLPWQRWLLIHALELRPNGRFRFRNVLVLVARQNGKTSLIEIKNLWKLFVLRVRLVIGTAQTLEYAEESWDKAVEIAESVPDLAAEIAHIDRTNGKKALKLHGGSRWKIATATRRGGRSLSGDDVNLDELREHQTWDAWGAVTKTTMARPNAQVWAPTNAGDDKSVVLNELLSQGRTAVAHPELADQSFGLFEWSAPDDVTCTCGRPDGIHRADCRLQDRPAWAQANPALGYTITEEAIAAALATDPVGVFRTEVLCQRVQDLRELWQVIAEVPWRAAVARWASHSAPPAFALEVALDRSQAVVAVATRRSDGLRQVQLAALEAGTGWVVGWCVERVRRWRACALVVDPGGPAGSLIADLEAKGVEVLKPTTRQYAAACGSFVDGVAGQLEDGADPAVVRDIRHTGQGQLDGAVAALQTRSVGDAVVFERDGEGFLVSAVALALWGHTVKAPEVRRAIADIW